VFIYSYDAVSMCSKTTFKLFYLFVYHGFGDLNTREADTSCI